MPAVRLGVGTAIKWNGANFTVRRGFPGGAFQIESDATGELRKTSLREIFAAIVAGCAHLVSGEAVIALRDQPDVDLSALPGAIQSQVLRRHAYIQEVSKGMPGLGVHGIVEVIGHVAGRISDPTPPSHQTVYRWYERFRKGGRDPRGLIPRTSHRGNRTRRLPGEVIEIVHSVVQQRYLVQTRPRVTDIVSAVFMDIARLNDQRLEDSRLPVPSTQTLRRHIRMLSRYHVTEMRYGKRAADLDARFIGRGCDAKWPLERVEIDHSKIDILVCDDRFGTLLGRPWLTICVDHFTRMPIGFYLGFTPPSTDSVLLALRHAICPKDYIKDRFPSIKGEWPCHGVFDQLVTDNGPEFHSQDLEIAAADVGFALHHTQVRAPWMKGVVERLFGEINRAVVGGRRGTTFHSPSARADYDSAREAAMPLSLLEEILTKWIVDIHGAKPHGGIQDIPLRRWAKGIEAAPPRLPASARTLNVLLAKSEARKLQQTGVKLFGLSYNSEELNALRMSHASTIEVAVKYDPRDLGRIYIRDTAAKRYFEVPALAIEYASGLGLWQHTAIARHVREELRQAVNLRALMEAKEDLHAWVEEAHAKAKGRRGRPKTHVNLARFMEAPGIIVQPPAGPTHLLTMVADPKVDDSTWLDEEIPNEEIEVTFNFPRQAVGTRGGDRA